MTDHDPASEPDRTNDLPTESPVLTDYDRAHMQVYIQILDADAAAAPWEGVASLVLGLDPVADPSAAKRSYDAHLARAKWMTQVGYRMLVNKP